MRFLTFLLLAALAVLGYQNRERFFPPHAPSLEFSDLEGRKHSLASPDKPVLMGFFISDCGYCRNMLGILNKASAARKADIEVYGFYLNDVAESEISSAAAEEGFSGILVKTQQRFELIDTFHKTFKIRGPGRDAYVVDKDGRFRTVPLVTDQDDFRPEAEVVSELEALLAKAAS